MAIKYNDTTLTSVKYNSGEIYLVTYNGTAVFDKINYTFPNSNAKMTSDSCLGINTYYDARYQTTYSAYKAFDNSTSTAFAGTKTETQTTGNRIAIVFPFNVQVQSITIKNAASGFSSYLSYSGGLRTGYIYMSSSALSDSSAITSSKYSITYATLSRGSTATTSAGSTTHTNSSYTSTNVRSILIVGNSWGSGTSTSHVIGEVSINFNVAYSTLKSWASTYSVTI